MPVEQPSRLSLAAAAAELGFDRLARPELPEAGDADYARGHRLGTRPLWAVPRSAQEDGSLADNVGRGGEPCFFRTDLSPGLGGKRPQNRVLMSSFDFGRSGWRPIVVKEVKYQFEYEHRVRCCFVGAGGHSFRNIYPSFQYAPEDLLAVCDLDAGRAHEYARLFGARASYSDYRKMLAEERPDAVFIVTGYGPDGRPLATDIALRCLDAGCHVWMEKPTAASVAEVLALQDASKQAGRFVMTGLKKVFTPAITKVKALITSPEFGEPGSITVRYPQALPPPEDRQDGTSMQSFLDHIYHPVAILLYLMGPVERMSYEWAPGTGATTTNQSAVPLRRRGVDAPRRRVG